MLAHLRQERTVSLPLFSALSFDLSTDLRAVVTQYVACAHTRAADALQADLPVGPLDRRGVSMTLLHMAELI
jgi:hypothetical protein